MIPLRLTVKNFMCYRENVPSLELEDIHVACLCGDNGHGKSAILDAITWALWGQARARTQEELIHQGRQDMAVELEFTARDRRYRASRRYSKSSGSKSGATLLELQVASDGEFTPITGNSVRDTENRIRELLHMDYETFVNTAFLLQGQADIFTRSSPSKRKEVLAEVLDLTYYQKLEQRAKEWSRKIHEATKDTVSAIDVRKQDIAQRQEYEERLASIRSELIQVAADEKAHRIQMESLRSSVDSLISSQNEADGLVGRVATGRKEIENLSLQAQNGQARIDKYLTILERESEIRDQFRQLGQTKTDLEHLDQAAFQAAKLSESKAKLSESISVQRERLEGQINQLRNRITEDLDPKARRLSVIEAALSSIASEQSDLDKWEQNIRLKQKEAQRISTQIGSLDQANSGLLSTMEETRKRFDMLGQDVAVCPLCRQHLGKEGQDHLRREYEEQGLESKRQHQEYSSEQARLQETYASLTSQISSEEALLNQKRKNTQNKIGGLERELEDSRKAQEELNRTTEKAEQAQSILKTGKFAKEERENLSRLNDKLTQLNYEADTHRKVQKLAQKLDQATILHQSLTDSKDALPREQDELSSTLQILKHREQDMAGDEKRLKTLAQATKSLEARKIDLAKVESRHRTMELEKHKAQVQSGILEGQLDRLQKLASEVKNLEVGRRALADDKSIADELTVAFGKNGIQALIIEAAIPQLQDDANELLRRMTEGRLSLKLQILEGRKERRIGLPSEELEIKIADEVGTRSYETFSGGEAFRINFALRIAMSKLLARRSGAPLPILFIDEGFGTQDSVGQERLKEAIQSIQSDFQKIIVITHVDEVKEAFPIRIEVTKSVSGSTFIVT